MRDLTMKEEEMKTTRRNVIFGAGALALVPLVPLVLFDNIPQYVTFPGPMWEKQFGRQVWRHTTQWRVSNFRVGPYDGRMFALGCEIPYPVKDSKEVVLTIRNYNKVLENIRRKWKFDEEMIYRAANEPYTLRWSKDGKRRCGNNEYTLCSPRIA